MTATYTIATQQRGNTTDWYLLRNGQRFDGYIYDTAERAQQVADLRAEGDRLDATIEQAIGQARHYGIVVTSEPGHGSTPTWRITDPHTGQENYAFAWYSHTAPPVDVYTRDQYETACAAVGITPADDTDLGNYADTYATYSPGNDDPMVILTATLRRRRLAGLLRERAAAQAARSQRLTAAGLADGPYTREQYERACTIMATDALDDGTCVAVADQHLARFQESCALTVGIPSDDVTVKLATRRVDAIYRAAETSGQRCDECGQVIVGDAMIASLGRACSPGCFDAMADHPGRYAAARR